VSTSTGESEARRRRISSTLPWAVAFVFVGITLPKLDVLRPNVDEGVYIQQARLVRQGQTPYVDFFYHQTPLYLYALAGFGSLGADSLAGYRFLSLLASALTGVLVFHAGRRLLDRKTGILAQLAFYAAPLHLYSFLALPNALTGLLTAAGVFAILLGPGLRWTLLGGFCLSIAVLVKPLAVPVVLAILLTLVLFPGERRRLPALVSSGTAIALAAWVFLHASTGGGFTEVLRLQAQRYSSRTGFELMSHYRDFRNAMILRGVDTPTGWNWSEHSRAFSSGGFTNGNFWLFLAAAASPFLWKRSMPRPLLAGLALWLLLAVSFSLFVWEPIWDHYFVMYLPPLALFASVSLEAALAGRRWWARTSAVVALLGCTVLGHTQRFTEPLWYRQARATGKQARGGEFLSFNPLIHVVSGTRPACGLIDPLNVYGERAIAALDPGGPMKRFEITAEDLVRCLGDDTWVVIDDYAFWFLDPPLLAHLERTPHRLIFFGPFARARFESAKLEGSQRRPDRPRKRRASSSAFQLK
jgi:4-amino-4-deoxy-L-arabinose transferase-like glycosyltransferase